MTALSATASTFRWRSALGIAVALFLVMGALNLLAAVFVPISLHLNGPGPGGVLILGNEIDSAMLGRPVDGVAKTDARLASFLVTLMDTMCAFMFAYGVMYVAVAWSALRRGEPWALWALAIGGLAWLPHYVVVSFTYASFGAAPALAELAGFLGFIVPVLVATVFGWRGVAKARATA